MIAAIIPAHDEADHIGRCLTALAAAAQNVGLGGEAVELFVVADDCSDDSERFARMVADLPVFVRQSHGERDFAALGNKAATVEESSWAL